MELWTPPTDRPQLLEWWRPLIEASRLARHKKIPWSVNVDEFMLMGRVDRKSRPCIWIYKHVETRRELCVDDAVQPYRFRPTPNGKGIGRFDKIDIRRAIWATGLPELDGASTWHEDWDDWTIAADPEVAPYPLRSHPAGRRAAAPTAPLEAPMPAPEPRRRGHLTVIDGGALAG